MAALAAVGRAEEHRFFTRLALVILGLTVLGFSRTYLLVPLLGLPPDTLPATTLVHVHAAVAFGWCFLFVVQAWLVASGRTPQHRRLGMLGVALYAALVLLGMVAMLTAPFGRLLPFPYLLNHVVGPGVVVVALAWWDHRALGRLHPVTRYGGPAILLWELLPNAYMTSAWWLATSRWLVSALAG